MTMRDRRGADSQSARRSHPPECDKKRSCAPSDEMATGCPDEPFSVLQDVSTPGARNSADMHVPADRGLVPGFPVQPQQGAPANHAATAPPMPPAQAGAGTSGSHSAQHTGLAGGGGYQRQYDRHLKPIMENYRRLQQEMLSLRGLASLHPDNRLRMREGDITRLLDEDIMPGPHFLHTILLQPYHYHIDQSMSRVFH